jgi:RNA polymerase sigma-32 factor
VSTDREGRNAAAREDQAQPKTGHVTNSNELPGKDGPVPPTPEAEDEPIDLELVPDEAVLATVAAPAALRKVASSTLAPSDPFARYLFEVRKFEPLLPEEEAQLARRYRDTGDQEAAARLISHNLLLVVKLALMYRRALTNVMDLVQEGNIGLLEALKRFDPEQGVRFNTYAAWWIKAYILKYLLDNARLVRVGTTNARRKLLYNLRREQRKLEAQGISATPRLLAERLNVPEADVIDVDRALSGGDVSTDQPVGEDSSATFGDFLEGKEASIDEQVIAAEMKQKIDAAIAEFRKGLSERDQAILDARLASVDEATLQELGERFGVTREAMRQAEAKLKSRMAVFLRQELGDDVIMYFTS